MKEISEEEVKRLTSKHGTPVKEEETYAGTVCTTIFSLPNGQRIKTVFNAVSQEPDAFKAFLLEE